MDNLGNGKRMTTDTPSKSCAVAVGKLPVIPPLPINELSYDRCKALITGRIERIKPEFRSRRQYQRSLFTFLSREYNKSKAKVEEAVSRSSIVSVGPSKRYVTAISVDADDFESKFKKRELEDNLKCAFSHKKSKRSLPLYRERVVQEKDLALMRNHRNRLALIRKGKYVDALRNKIAEAREFPQRADSPLLNKIPLLSRRKQRRKFS